MQHPINTLLSQNDKKPRYINVYRRADREIKSEANKLFDVVWNITRSNKIGMRKWNCRIFLQSRSGNTYAERRRVHQYLGNEASKL